MKKVYVRVALLSMTVSALLGAGCGSGSSGTKVDPANFTTQIDNPFFPLTPGTTFIYEGTKEGSTLRDEFVVTSETKVIQGVTTRVIHDKIFIDGVLHEDTLDWFAQDKAGNVWYFGEDTRELDASGIVTSTAGSFEAGVNSAKAGIIMKGNPVVGETYYQEFSKNVAEDQATVLDFNSTATTPKGTFTNCFKTKDFTRLNPGAVDEKYYARGVGFVLSVAVQGGSERLALKEIIKP
jgi:hypothetical protein